jgi:predicted dinucleotide-utilizing enzyme
VQLVHPAAPSWLIVAAAEVVAVGSEAIHCSEALLLIPHLAFAEESQATKKEELGSQESQQRVRVVSGCVCGAAVVRADSLDTTSAKAAS